MPRTQYNDIEKKLLLPDQSLLIPSVGHHIARQLQLCNRAIWSDTGPKASVWRPMIRLDDDTWVNAQWLEWFGSPRELMANRAFVMAIKEERSSQKRAPGGRLLPVRFADVVRLIHPEVGLYAAFPGQWTPSWSSIVFRSSLASRDIGGLQYLAEPDQVQSWWIDDLYVPHSTWWWEHFMPARAHTYWVVTYTNSPGFARCTGLECQWVVRIPAGALHMRTDFSVIQPHCQQQFRVIYTQKLHTHRNRSIRVCGYNPSCAGRCTSSAGGITVPTMCPRISHLTTRGSKQLWNRAMAKPIVRMVHPDFGLSLISRLVELHPPAARLPGASRLHGPSRLAPFPDNDDPERDMGSSNIIHHTRLAFSSYTAVLWNLDGAKEIRKITCDRCDQAIRRRRRNALRKDVNTGIKSRRKAWAQPSKGRITRTLLDQKTSLRVRSRKWLAARNQRLRDPTHDDSDN